MKKFLKNSLLNSFSLYFVASINPGLIIPSDIYLLIWAGMIFTLINFFVKPIIKLFLLPINLLSLGLFSWIANVLILVVLTQINPAIKIVSFTAKAYSQSGFLIPALSVNLVFSYILTSFLLSLVFNSFANILAAE